MELELVQELVEVMEMESALVKGLVEVPVVLVLAQAQVWNSR